jgi:hypothetical protein
MSPGVTPPPVEESLRFWYPGRFGVKFAPDEFQQKLQALHPDLEATWHPIKERWLIWYKRPRIKNPHSPGWMLLFVVEDSAGDFVPLDARTLALVYKQSGFTWGSGKKYWARIEEEILRDRAKVDTDREAVLEDVGSDRWDHTKIQVSMRGPSNGSKFTRHHAGD